MKRAEMAQILKIVKISYPSQFSKLSNRDLEEMLIVWTDFFSEEDFNIAKRALNNYMRQSGTNFAPTPPTLYAEIKKIKEQQTLNDPNTLDKYRAWDLIEKTMQSADFHYEPYDTFKKLPNIVQKAVGNVGVLRKWSVTDIDRMDFIKRDFLNRYSEYQEYASDSDYQMLEGEVKQLETTAPEIREVATVAERLADMFAYEESMTNGNVTRFMNELKKGVKNDISRKSD